MFKTVYRLISNVVYYISSACLDEPSADELNLINKLKDDIVKLPPVQNISDSPSEIEWTSNRYKLRNYILNRDPRIFLKWDVIRYTMFVQSSDYIDAEFMAISSNNKWISSIKESKIGSPKTYKKYKSSSANLVHHAYSLFVFENTKKIDVNSFKFVLEFGGGYGSMCRLFHNNGFDGRYIIYDLPEFCCLQKYFLSSLGILANQNKTFSDRVATVSDIDELRKIMYTADDNSLFIATWSLSEVPLIIRKDILNILPSFNSYLIAFQGEFNDIDNVDYFKSFADNYPTYIWDLIEIDHLRGNYYLLGTKQN